jgi:hypothetical protein
MARREQWNWFEKTPSNDRAPRAAAWSLFAAQIQRYDSFRWFHVRGDCDIFVEMKKKRHIAFIEARSAVNFSKWCFAHCH